MTTSTQTPPLSPMMVQWYTCKKQAKGALLLFRLGDFYEAFHEDARLLAQQLDLTLTQRQGVPMSGIPVHTCEAYVEQLIKKDFMVAIAEQLDDPKQVKGLVRREVVRILSPGALLTPNFLSDRANNFLVSLYQGGDLFALALTDLSTGELRVVELDHLSDLKDELFRRCPREILMAKDCYQQLRPLFEEIKTGFRCRLTLEEPSLFDPQTHARELPRHFQVHTLASLGLQGKEAVVGAVGGLIAYLRDYLHMPVKQITHIHLDRLDDYLIVDRSTQRHLELITPSQSDHLGDPSQALSLLSLLDQTRTAMGSRLLKRWVSYPLISIEQIQERQDAIEELLLHLKLAQLLTPIKDLERLITRIASGTPTPRDLLTLHFSLAATPPLMDALSRLKSPLIQRYLHTSSSLQQVAAQIRETLVDEPRSKVGDEPLIRQGFDSQLDHLRSIQTDSKQWIASYETELKEKFGIKTLKIIYSRTFGFCIETSRAQSNKLPTSFLKRQTLVNTERFTSPQLQQHEVSILEAQEQIEERESQIYRALIETVSLELEEIQKVAEAIAHFDALLALASVADRMGYVRPQVDDSNTTVIEEGRHPIIEATLPGGSFIPNAICLNDTTRFLLISGPNMSGKSTYIRMVALITYMAQIGSFIPARSAQIGLVDRILSRIGASDNLAMGQSTFMVEMAETAHILKEATARSLVILDEIGRGTSTHDGIALAWVVAEELLNRAGVGVRTLFATHYFELTALEQSSSKFKNVHVTVQEHDKQVVFLRKIEAGSSRKSYGLHVARLAGFKPHLLERAATILSHLQQVGSPLDPAADLADSSPAPPMPILRPDPETPQARHARELLLALEELELDRVTPIEAHRFLSRWQTQLSSTQSPV